MKKILRRRAAVLVFGLLYTRLGQGAIWETAMRETRGRYRRPEAPDGVTPGRLRGIWYLAYQDKGDLLLQQT